MEETFFSKNWSEPKGALLYQSVWLEEEGGEPRPVQLYERAIEFKASILPFTFDLRFMTLDDKLTFYLQDNEITFALPAHDWKQWRTQLKTRLNQVGFHEQFKPIKKIGKGNFASVYLVERFEDKQKYAVKAFSKQAAYSEQNGKECLIKQIEIMRHLNDNHNMKLSQVFESDNSLYIIFQLLDGGQLYEKIKAKQKFKPELVRRMIRGILSGLKEMHAKNIMHRDLKPENILLRSKDSYECVIADYGLAEFAHSEEYLFVRCGTPGYVAPEVINIKDMKAKYQPICDIFSLGLIFHLLLFGQSVFKGKTYNEVLKENKNCTFCLESEQYQKVDPIVMNLLRKMLKIDPEERITAEAALFHPYFREEVQQDYEDVYQLRDTVSTEESPILTSGNEMRKKAKELERDSCVDFKMGKDNIITGKTETVGSVPSGKISGFGAGLLKGFKPSKFVKPSEQLESKQN